jgi:hypothetical protein
MQGRQGGFAPLPVGGRVFNPEINVKGEHRFVAKQKVHASDQKIPDVLVVECENDVVDIHVCDCIKQRGMVKALYVGREVQKEQGREKAGIG